MGKIADCIKESFIRMLRDELNEAGFAVSPNATEDQVMITYFTKCLSFLLPRKYHIHTHPEFKCPIEYKEGFDQLLNKMKQGENINAYLSRITKSTTRQDSMLHEWGLFHFHLGCDIDYDGYMQRTKDVLYAFIKEDDIFLIGIYEHGKWSDKDLIEVLHKYYPDSIAENKMANAMLETTFSAEDRNQLRKARINMAVQMDDGTCYIGPGWGINAAGSSAWASLRMIEKHREFDIFEKLLLDQDPNAENRSWVLMRVDDKIYFANDADIAYLLYQWPTLKKRIGIIP